MLQEGRSRHRCICFMCSAFFTAVGSSFINAFRRYCRCSKREGGRRRGRRKEPPRPDRRGRRPADGIFTGNMFPCALFRAPALLRRTCRLPPHQPPFACKAPPGARSKTVRPTRGLLYRNRSSATPYNTLAVVPNTITGPAT